MVNLRVEVTGNPEMQYFKLISTFCCHAESFPSAIMTDEIRLRASRDDEVTFLKEFMYTCSPIPLQEGALDTSLTAGPCLCEAPFSDVKSNYICV